MKIALLSDGYLPVHEAKCQGSIALGLNRIARPTSLITLSKPGLTGYVPPFPIISTTKQSLVDIGFWQGIEADVVICYTWLNPRNSGIVAAIRGSGKKIILKADSDGRLGYPVIHGMVPGCIQRLIDNPLGRFWYKSKCERRAQQIQMAHAVIIESPKALDNVSNYLRYWGKSYLLSRFHVIPNPVSDDISESEIRGKRDIIVAVGRWDDRAKNASLMLKCLEQFLTDNPTWNARVIATMSNGMSQLERATSCWPIELRDRMEILGHSPHHMIVEILNSAKMFFMPSRWEGFPTAAAEAVCMGCTVVGTPLESLDFLVANGFSGTLSRSFRAKDVSDALKIDSVKHRQGVYDAHEIADYWRTRLSMGEVTSQVCELLDEVLERNA